MHSRTRSGVTVPSIRAYKFSASTTVPRQCAYRWRVEVISGLKLMASGIPLEGVGAESRHWRTRSKPGHHVIVTFVWWCVAGALPVISAALFRREMAILSAANPAARLPWIGWPPNTPRSAKVLQFFAVLALVLEVDCVFYALGQRHLYAVLWCLPFALSVLAVITVLQAKHKVCLVPPGA